MCVWEDRWVGFHRVGARDLLLYFEDNVSTMQDCFTCSVIFLEIIIFILQYHVSIFALCVSTQPSYYKSQFSSDFEIELWKHHGESFTPLKYFNYSSNQRLSMMSINAILKLMRSRIIIKTLVWLCHLIVLQVFILACSPLGGGGNLWRLG